LSEGSSHNLKVWLEVQGGSFIAPFEGSQARGPRGRSADL
jgi:hypothetical protein